MSIIPQFLKIFFNSFRVKFEASCFIFIPGENVLVSSNIKLNFISPYSVHHTYYKKYSQKNHTNSVPTFIRKHHLNPSIITAFLELVISLTTKSYVKMIWFCEKTLYILKQFCIITRKFYNNEILQLSLNCSIGGTSILAWCPHPSPFLASLLGNLFHLYIPITN